VTEVGRDDEEIVWIGEIPRKQLSVRLFPVERQRTDKNWHNGELSTPTTAPCHTTHSLTCSPFTTAVKN